MAKFIDSKIKYVFLVLAVIFMAFSITYFANHVSDIGLRPYSNITADRMTGEGEFLLHVKKPAAVFLLHNVQIASGYIKFEMIRDDGEIIENYKLTSDDFINKVIELEEGTYHCTISSDVTKTRASLRFYYDKRFIKQEYLKNDSRTETIS